MVVHTGTSQLKIIWNLIQENSENIYEFSSAEKRDLTIHRLDIEKMQAFSIPYRFRVTGELEFLYTIQSFSGIEQWRGVNNFCPN